ncbi:MFS transporter [Mycoplasmopsis edwardii]|nr:hypothetical protein [Mycoplasmopsis edwardii]
MVDTLSYSQNTGNKFKYTLALIISIMGTEALKIASAVYIFKLTDSFWLQSIFFLILQLPSIFIFLSGSKILNRFTNKQIIFFADISSLTVVLIVLTIFLSIDATKYANFFSWVLIISGSLYSLFNAVRFLAVKNIIFYLSNNSNDMKKYNLLNNIGILFASFMSPILGFVLFKNLPFWSILVLNIITYLVSTSLYMLLKTKVNHIEFVRQKDNDIHVHDHKTLKWTFAISFGLLISLLIYPRQSGVNQFFKFINYDYKEWTFIFTIVIFGLGLVGGLCSFLTNRLNNKRKSTMFNIVILIIGSLNFIWMVFLSSNNAKLILISYLVLNALIQYFHSLILSIGNNYIFMIFDKKEFTKQNAFILFIRIIFYSTLIILLTVLYLYVSYEAMFITFSVILFITCFIIFYSKHKIEIKN